MHDQRGLIFDTCGRHLSLVIMRFFSGSRNLTSIRMSVIAFGSRSVHRLWGCRQLRAASRFSINCEEVRNLSPELTRQLVASQDRLYAYVLSQVLDLKVAEDILQQVNLVICQKSNEFVPGTNFAAWACKIAHYKVLAFRRDQGRDREVLDDKVISMIAVDGVKTTESVDHRREALLLCLPRLSKKQRMLLRGYYESDQPITDLATQLGKTKRSIESSLYRIRRELFSCIQQTIAMRDV